MLQQTIITIFLVFSSIFSWSSKVYAVDPSSRFKVSGVIESALKKNGNDQSIVVLYDGQKKKTLVLKAGEEIAGTEFKIAKITAKEVTLQDSYGGSYLLRPESFDGPSTTDTSRVAKRTYNDDDWEDEFDDEGLGSDVYRDEIYDDMPTVQTSRGNRTDAAAGTVTTLPATEVAPAPAPDEVRYRKRPLKTESRKSLKKYAEPIAAP